MPLKPATIAITGLTTIKTENDARTASLIGKVVHVDRDDDDDDDDDGRLVFVIFIVIPIVFLVTVKQEPASGKVFRVPLQVFLALHLKAGLCVGARA